jgi:hypothetical protein
MDITMDASGTAGTAVMLIDFSAIDLGEDVSTSNEPQTIRFKYDGTTMSFDMSASSSAGFPSTMTARVSRSGVGLLLMTGSMIAGDPSTMGMKAEFQLTKQVIM